jgi:deazaflavin-dependent oxidoreductase (nitroreductase family)
MQIEMDTKDLQSPRIGLGERLAVWMEVEILSALTPKNKPGSIFKWLFKIPILYYRLGLGWMIGKNFLLLTTIGRKTGKFRSTPLEYVHDAQTGWYRVSPGWGGNTDWYKNLRHNPNISVNVGRRKFKALAEPAPDEEAARFMITASKRHPTMDKVWNRWTDKPVDGSWESYVHAAQFFPSVWLKPQDDL